MLGMAADLLRTDERGDERGMSVAFLGRMCVSVCLLCL